MVSHKKTLLVPQLILINCHEFFYSLFPETNSEHNAARFSNCKFASNRNLGANPYRRIEHIRVYFVKRKRIRK